MDEPRGVVPGKIWIRHGWCFSQIMGIFLWDDRGLEKIGEVFRFFRISKHPPKAFKSGLFRPRADLPLVDVMGFLEKPTEKHAPPTWIDSKKAKKTHVNVYIYI
jgi:hypothetical protein